MDSDDDFYSDDDAVDAEQGYLDNDPDDSDYSKQQNYVVLSEADIRQRQEDDIAALSSLLSIAKADCAILLGHYNWSVSKVHEEWFADEESVRKAVGLFNHHSKPSFGGDETLTCRICFDTFSKDDLYDAACEHPFCGACWGGYISSSINDGPGCLTLHCPDPSCSAAVGRDMIDALAVSDDDRKKYARYLVRSYVEDNRKTKWCPAPGCEYAVDFVVGSNFDVVCGCSYGFCWNCTEEAHRPVDCGTVKEWITKNSSESENTNWILVNSKPCPKCKRPIEKNHGCMHMTCRQPCRFEFCWLCLGAWKDHNGSYACNRYKTSEHDEDERRRLKAKKYLERYAHYYERWAANEKSRQKAMADLEQIEKVHLGKLIEVQWESEAQLKFLVEAWSQIVECRRVLKWTYAYGYYLPEHESGKRQLFEYLQGQAEAGLERLHQCAENELQGHLNPTTELQGPSDDFNQFRTKLAGLTSVTRNYFENLVRALENGLSELDSNGGTAGSQAKTEGGGGSDMVVGQKRKASTSSVSIMAAAAHDITTIAAAADDDLNNWPCDRCTYVNDSSTTVCRMCNP